MTNMNQAEYKIEGKRIYLRQITLNDVTEEYVSWLHDEEVNRFLESRFIKHAQENVKEYVQKVSKDQNYLFLAIVRKDNNKHIGNIKVGPIDWHNKISDQGIMIGDRNSWGKGFATEAFKLVADYAFQVLKLHKMTSAVYESNVGSIVALEKGGYHEEGRRKKQLFHNGKYEDCVLMAKFSDDK